MDGELLALARALFPDVKTTRGLQNIAYLIRATRILIVPNDSRFSWLGEAQKADAGMGDLKLGILAELGRIPDEEQMKAVALAICELKPNTRDAVNRIRRFRTGKTSAGDALALCNEILDKVNDYVRRHPGMPWQDVVNALYTALEQVKGGDTLENGRDNHAEAN